MGRAHGGWIGRHRVRFVLYMLLLAALAGGAAAAILFLSGGDRGTAAWVASRAPVRAWLAGHGIGYGFDSLSIGGLKDPCPFEVRARGVRLELAGPPDLRAAAASVGGCAASKVEIAGIRAGVAGFDVAVARAEATLPSGRYSADDLTVADHEGPVLAQRRAEVALPGEAVLLGTAVHALGSPEQAATIGHTRLSGLAYGGDSVRVRSVEVENVRAVVDESAWNEARVRRWQAAAAQIAGLPRAALARAGRIVADAQSILGWAALAALAFFFALKFLVAGVAGGWWLRLALASAAVAPAAVYFVFRPHAGSLALLVAAAGCALAVAVLLYFALYRRAPEWHARLEPALVDTVAPPLIALLLIGWGYTVRLPGFAWPRTVEVDRMEVADAEVRARARACGVAEVARIGAQATAEGLRVALDPETLAVERIEVRTAAHGEASSSFVPDFPARMAFCAAAAIGPDHGAAPPLPACEARGDAVALAASVALDAKRFTAAYDARARGRTAGVAWNAAVAGDAREAVIRSLGAEGAVRVASGAGRVRLTPAIRSSLALRGIGAAIAGASLSIGEVDVTANVGGRCAAPSWSATTSAAGVHAALPGGWSLTAARSSAAASGSRRSVEARSVLEELAVEAPSIGLNATVPRIRSAVQAKTAAGIEGTVSFDLSGTGGGALAAMSPVSFFADFPRGEFRLPRQPWQLKQAPAKELPDALAGELAAAAKWDVRARRAHGGLSLSVGLRDGPVDIAGDWRYAPGTFDYRAKATLPEVAVPLPAVPPAVVLRRIGAFDLHTTGKLIGFRLDRLASPGEFRQPVLPEALAFRVEAEVVNGVAAASVLGRGGRGIRVADARFRPERIEFRDGALGEFAGSATVGQISAADGQGALALRSGFRLVGGGVETSAAMSDAAGIPLLATRATWNTGEARISSAEPFALARLYPAVEPFLRHFGWEVRGLEPLAAIRSFDTRLRLEGNALAGAAARVELAPGPLLRAPGTAAWLDTGAGFDLNYRRSSADVSADLRGLRVELRDTAGAVHEIAASVRAEAAADLPASAPAETALGRAAADLLLDARGHFDEAARVFGEAGPAGLDASWDVRARNSGGNALEWSGERLETRVDTEIRALRLGEWSLGGTAGLRAAASLFRDHLMLDAHAPLAVDLQAPGGARSAIRFEQPFALALAPKLRAAPPLLFDSGHYAGLFRDFPKTYARGGPAEVFAAPPLPLSVGLKPLFAAVGYRGALQFCPPPFSGRLAHGDLHGEAHAELRWQPGGALLDFAAASKFAGVEAGDIRFLLGGVENALLEHRLDGSLSARAAALPLSRETVRQLAADPEASPLLRIPSIRLRAATSDAPGNIGILQAGASVDLPALNAALRKVARDLRLTGPGEALRFRKMDFELDMAGGQVSVERPLLRLFGLQLAAGGLESATDLRVHLGRAHPELKPYTAAELAGFLRRLLAGMPKENR